jgi:hypothetical protein
LNSCHFSSKDLSHPSIRPSMGSHPNYLPTIYRPTDLPTYLPTYLPASFLRFEISFHFSSWVRCLIHEEVSSIVGTYLPSEVPSTSDIPIRGSYPRSHPSSEIPIRGSYPGLHPSSDIPSEVPIQDPIHHPRSHPRFLSRIASIIRDPHPRFLSKIPSTIRDPIQGPHIFEVTSEAPSPDLC